MKEQELKYFCIEGNYGGCQDWFRDYMMKVGGCAAATACDSSIYFDLYCGTHLVPTAFVPSRPNGMTKRAYRKFASVMKPYLRPRWRGIDRLELYIEGYGRFLSDRNEHRIHMTPLPGSVPTPRAAKALRQQIDIGLPIPCLTLHHRDPDFSFYEWHWYLLTGYRETNEGLQVKAATYGNGRWLSFPRLWNTGYEEQGGLILYHRHPNAEHAE